MRDAVLGYNVGTVLKLDSGFSLTCERAGKGMKQLRVIIITLCLAALAACSQPINKSTGGALTGGALGAGMGAIIGNQTGHAGAGTAIGAAAGALGGALIGNSMDNQDSERARVEEQQRRQAEEIERQRREIEEMKRQQRYDDVYRRY